MIGIMFNKKNKGKPGAWIRREHSFGGDDYVCSACGAKFKKQSLICPKCKALMTKIKADPRWIDRMKMLDSIS